MIEFFHVSKTYFAGSPVPALRDVNLTIRENEYVGVVGPSGSGKSTLLHLLGLLDVPTGGTLLFDGRNTATFSETELSKTRGRSIGFVFQSFHLVSHLSVQENVELPLFYQGMGPRERRERAEEQLGRVNLLHRRHHRPRQLSGGECQRTAIARALVTSPRLVLADEPTGNLDSKTGAEILALFDALQAAGKTLVVITHDLTVARRIPRIVRITDGTVVEDPGA